MSDARQPTHLDLVRLEELRVETLTRDFLGDYGRTIEAGFDLFVRWQLAASARRLDHGPFHAVILFYRLRNHFWNAWRLLLQGYYLDAVNLHKTAFETFFLADYLDHPALEGRGCEQRPQLLEGERPADTLLGLAGPGPHLTAE